MNAECFHSPLYLAIVLSWGVGFLFSIMQGWRYERKMRDCGNLTERARILFNGAALAARGMTPAQVKEWMQLAERRAIEVKLIRGPAEL